MSKKGCQADFEYKYSLILEGSLEKFSILELINNFFCIRGTTKSGKLITTVWGFLDYVLRTTQNYHFFLRRPLTKLTLYNVVNFKYYFAFDWLRFSSNVFWRSQKSFKLARAIANPLLAFAALWFIEILERGENILEYSVNINYECCYVLDWPLRAKNALMYR